LIIYILHLEYIVKNDNLLAVKTETEFLMPRPSMKDQRREEILDAFERSIGQVGLHGSSLEVIADEAGMQRSILRHYIGNRDEILEALAERVIARYRTETDELLDYIPNVNQAQALVEILFDSSAATTAQGLAVGEAILTASAEHTKIRKLFADWLDHFVTSLSGVLHQAHPNQPEDKCWTVAYGIASIYFSHDSMGPIGLPRKFDKAAQTSARLLAASLG
jgi:AcrR family transcriptional regulator